MPKVMSLLSWLSERPARRVASCDDAGGGANFARRFPRRRDLRLHLENACTETSTTSWRVPICFRTWDAKRTAILKICDLFHRAHGASIGTPTSRGPGGNGGMSMMEMGRGRVGARGAGGTAGQRPAATATASASCEHK